MLTERARVLQQDWQTEERANALRLRSHLPLPIQIA